MFIYATHNFAENWCNAIGSGDDFMLQEMVIDELARLIVENKRDVVDLLRRHSVNVSINDPKSKIASILVKYVGSDEKIRADVTDMINKKAVDMDKFVGFVNKEIFFKVDGPMNTQEKKEFDARKKNQSDPFAKNIKKVINDKEPIKSFIGSLNNTLEKTFTNKKTEKAPKSPLEINSKILDQRIIMNEMKLNATGSGLTQNQWMWIGIGTAVVIIAGVIIYFKYFNNKGTEGLPPTDPSQAPATPAVNTSTV